MKVKELIAKLQEFDPELEVAITDGFSGAHYHTKNIEIKVFKDDEDITLDIGIGGNRIRGW